MGSIMRKALCLLSAVMILCVLSLTAAAEFYPGEGSSVSMNPENMVEQLWQDKLRDKLPSGAADFLEDSSEGIAALFSQPGRLWEIFKKAVAQKFQLPVEAAARLMGCILLCGLLTAIRDSYLGQELQSIFFATTAACVVSFLQGPIFNCITQSINALQETSLFLMSFVPVLSGVMAAGGHPASAGAYNLMLFFTAEILTGLASRWLVPLLSIYLALCIVSPLAPFLKISRLTSGIKYVVCWGLSIISTVFVGMLSLQTAIARGGDSMLLKTSKLLVGSFIPVIGSTISDALDTAKGCMAVVKNVVGSLGISAAALTLLPPLLEVFLWYLAVKLSAWLGELLDAREVSSILSSVAQTFSLLIAMIGCFMLLFLVSTALMLYMTVG